MPTVVESLPTIVWTPDLDLANMERSTLFMRWDDPTISMRKLAERRDIFATHARLYPTHEYVKLISHKVLAEDYKMGFTEIAELPDNVVHGMTIGFLNEGEDWHPVAVPSAIPRQRAIISADKTCDLCMINLVGADEVIWVHVSMVDWFQNHRAFTGSNMRVIDLPLEFMYP